MSTDAAPAAAEQQQQQQEQQQPAGACSTSGRPHCHLITFNVGKKHNIGTLLRCATAFNVKEVHLVGSRAFNTFGSHGSDHFVALRHHSTLELCCKYLREVEGATQSATQSAAAAAAAATALCCCLAPSPRPLLPMNAP
jgi:hypothetical protein